MTTHEGSDVSGTARCVRSGGDAAPRPADASRSFARPYWWSLLLALVLFPWPASALLITLSFGSVAGSVPVSGGGTASAALNFGTVSAFEPLTAGVSRTVGASSYTVSTQFGVRATHLVGLVSPSYTLQARLLSAHPLSWRVDGLTMTTTPVTFATSQPYGPVVPHTLAFVVPYSHAAGSVTTVLEVTAIAN